MIAEPADVDEVLALAQRYAIPPERIWLMAEGTDSATLEPARHGLRRYASTTA